jgi:hypothetical protein
LTTFSEKLPIWPIKYIQFLIFFYFFANLTN